MDAKSSQLLRRRAEDRPDMSLERVAGLSEFVDEFRRVAETGDVTRRALTGLGEVATYDGAELRTSSAGTLADKALRLHALGFDVSGEVRYLLHVDAEEAEREKRATPVGDLAVRDRLAEVARSIGTSDEGLRALEPRTTFHPWGSRQLSLYTPPTIWAPGMWTETFAQALFRRDRMARYRDLSVLELGTGSGALAIGMFFAGAAQVVGLDINPDAPLVAAVNSAINVTPADRGRLLFRHGNLLDREGLRHQWDLIFGCIPQVLWTAEEIVSSNLIGRLIGDVYFGTGEIEDLFGLGLVARALRQSQAHLRPGGRVEFVVAGRPGLQTILELFMRHGYHPRVIHRRRIPQDQDPPMQTFIDLEQRGGVPFEFYVPGEAEPVSATVAARYRLADISHDLYVVEGRPYRATEFGGVSEFLRRRQQIGYTEDPGTEDPQLRRQIAKSYEAITGIRVDPEIVFIGTAAGELLSQVLQAVVPGGGAVLYSTRNWNRFAAVRRNLTGLRHLQADDSLEAIARAMEEQDPRVVVFNITIQERGNYAGLRKIAEIADRKGIRLVTAGLFHRRPSGGGGEGTAYPIARLLQEIPGIAENLIVLNDLTRRYSLATTRLSYAIVPDRAVYQAMARLGEVTYSRASTVGQAVATHLLQRLGPRRPRTAPAVLLGPITGNPARIDRRLGDLAGYPTFEPKSWVSKDPIRLDFGESEFEAPPEIVKVAHETARDPATSELDLLAQRAAAQYLTESRGVEGVSVVEGAGVLPLQYATLRALAREAAPRGRLLVLAPRPLYDVHRPMILAAGGTPVLLRSEGTLLQPDLIDEGSFQRHPTALLLTQPTNPGGQFYPREALVRLAERTGGMTLLSDEVFGKVAFNNSPGLISPQTLPTSGPHWKRVVTFFGLSKEFAAPGLRAGFAATGDRELAAAIRREILTPPDRLALSASVAAFQNWRPMVDAHLRFLSPRREALEGFLGEAGLPFLPAQGGFGTLVDFSPIYGRRYRGTVIARDNLASLLDQGAGVVIHPPGWGDTDHVRLVFAVKRIDEAIIRLRRFLHRLT